MKGPRTVERIAPVVLAALLVSSAAAAEDTPPSDAEIAAETARINALAELQKARNARVAEAVTPLKGFAGEGKVELGDHAGEMEAWLLASDTLGAAGKLIADAAAPMAGKLIVLAGDEALDFTPLFATRYAIQDSRQTLNVALRSAPRCIDGGGPASAESSPARLPMLAAIGALGSVLQSDVGVTGVPVEVSARLLATSVAEALGNKAIVPAALTLPPKNGSSLQDELQLTGDDRALAAARQGCLTRAGKSRKAAAIALGAAIEAHDKVINALKTGKEGGEAPIITALKLDWLVSDNPRLLRVYVDKAGGTLLTRKNIWTAFGAPSVGVTGGLVSSFTVLDPQSGSVAAAGLVACRTKLASLRAVQRGEPRREVPCKRIAP